jgi:hypothetical protein
MSETTPGSSHHAGCPRREYAQNAKHPAISAYGLRRDPRHVPDDAAPHASAGLEIDPRWHAGCHHGGNPRGERRPSGDRTPGPARLRGPGPPGGASPVVDPAGALAPGRPQRLRASVGACPRAERGFCGRIRPGGDPRPPSVRPKTRPFWSGDWACWRRCCLTVPAPFPRSCDLIDTGAVASLVSVSGRRVRPNRVRVHSLGGLASLGEAGIDSTQHRMSPNGRFR